MYILFIALYLPKVVTRTKLKRLGKRHLHHLLRRLRFPFRQSAIMALRTFCAYQTLSFSSNAFRALIYIKSIELLQPPFPTPPSTLSALEGPLSPLLDSINIIKNGEFMGITILLLDELGAYLFRRGATRHDASNFTIL
ncbi:hypothetical protein HID58_006659 [Brassica napus]|uniref:Uncharacterized protein n=1 Tax=Brassica napus TaxID=3708 RepID=A0ABQ8ECQ0_BRANA|nr:hypothetical protein HID58_006659 [Brassica napus]